MPRNRNAGTVGRPKLPTVVKSSLQDQLFENRLQIAERLVRAFREAGYSCDLGDSRDIGRAQTLRRDS